MHGGIIKISELPIVCCKGEASGTEPGVVDGDVLGTVPVDGFCDMGTVSFVGITGRYGYVVLTGAFEIQAAMRRDLSSSREESGS